MSDLKTYNVRSIHLEVTGKCNLNCKYCYNSKFNEKKMIETEMSTEDVKRLIREASDMGCDNFKFSGGDPFMRKDIFDIIEACAGKKVAFLTNGKKLSDKFIEKLAAYPQVKEIKITLDGFEEHDNIRTGSDHKQIIGCIKKLKKMNLSVVINTEVTERNLKDMKRLYNLLVDLKIDRWRVDLPFLLGRYIENYKDFKLPIFKDFIQTFKGILTKYIKHKPSFEFELFNIYKSEISPEKYVDFDASMHPCSYREGSFPLRPNGDMVFCPSMDIPMANFIKEKSLRDAIKKKYKHDFYNIRISDIIKCKDCRYLKLCGSGCRVDAYYYLGDFKEPDPIACNLMPLIEKEIIPILPDNIKEYFGSLIRKDGGYPENYILDSILGNQ